MQFKGLLKSANSVLYSSSSSLKCFQESSFICPYFYLKLHPRQSYLSLFQKSNPLAVHYEYASKPLIFNNSSTRFINKDFALRMSQLIGSIDPKDKATLRKRSKHFINKFLCNFFFEQLPEERVSRIIEQSSKVRQKKIDRENLSSHDIRSAFDFVLPSDIPEKYHGILLFKFFVLPSKENYTKYLENLNRALHMVFKDSSKNKNRSVKTFNGCTHKLVNTMVRSSLNIDNRMYMPINEKEVIKTNIEQRPEFFQDFKINSSTLN